MDSIISNYLSKLELGELKIFNNMAIIPLFTPINGSPHYLTLKEALEKRLLTITEVSQSGSVPELKVVNKAGIPVLLLDGEELAGAKQNRVLNTTILLKENSKTIIPVSCTEQGRWAYASREFMDSGNIDTWNLDAVINLGTCGGVHKGIKKLDLILANKTFQYDVIQCFGKSSEKFMKGLKTNLKTSWANLGSVAKRLHIGTIASADHDLCSKTRKILQG